MADQVEKQPAEAKPAERPIPSLRALTFEEQRAGELRALPWWARLVERAKDIPRAAVNALGLLPSGREAADSLILDYQARQQAIEEAGSALNTPSRGFRTPGDGSLVGRLAREGLLTPRITEPLGPIEVTKDAVKAGLKTILTIDEWLGGFLAQPIADLIAGRKPEAGESLTIPDAVIRSYPGGAQEMLQRIQDAEGPDVAKQLSPIIRGAFFAVLSPLGMIPIGSGGKAAQGAKEAQGLVRLERFQKRLPRGALSPLEGSPDINEIRGAEAARLAQDPEALRRLNFQVAGKKPEAAMRDLPFKAEVEVPRSKLYDLEQDPEGIVEEFRSKGGINEIERQIKQKGYLGYITEDGHAALFDKVPVKRRFKRQGRGFVEVTDLTPEDIARTADEALNAFLASGREGATVHLTYGNQMGEDLWAVSIFPERERQIAGREITKHDIEDFVRANADILQNDQISVGLWTDKQGVIHLEPSAMVPDRELAVRLGRQFDQPAISNLKTGETVSTSGAGKPDVTRLPPLDARLTLVTGNRAETEAMIRLPKPSAPMTPAEAEAGLPPTIEAEILKQSLPVEDELRRMVLAGETQLTTRAKNQLAIVGAALIHRGVNSFAKFAKEMRGVVDDRIAQHFTADILKTLWEKSKAKYEEVLKTYAAEDVPSVKQLSELYHAGKFSLKWYDAFRPNVERAFGTEPIVLPTGAVTSNAEMFARFFAATSANVPGKENIELAIRAYSEWKRGVPFSNNFPGHRMNLERAAAGLPFSENSHKVRSFFLNLWGDKDAVTADGWVAEIFGFSQENLKNGRYQFIQETVRQEARRLGIDPRQYQAALWAGYKLKTGEQAGAEADVLTQITDFLEKNPELVPPEIRQIQQFLRAENEKVGGLDERGIAALPTVFMLARAVAGFTAGAAGSVALAQDEDAIRNGLIGAGLAALATPQHISKILNVLREFRIKDEERIAFFATNQGRTLSRERAWQPHEIAQLYQRELEEFRQGVRTWDEVFDEASLMARFEHMTPGKIRAMHPGTILNDGETMAASLVISEGFDKLKRMAENASPDDATSVSEVLAQLLELGRLDVRRLAVGTEQGRALNVNKLVQRELPQLSQIGDLVSRLKAGQPPERILQLIRELPGPEETMVMARMLAKPKFKDMVIEAWANGILSGFKTLTINAIGNPAFLLMNTAERGLSRFYQNAVAPGEASQMLIGIMEAFGDAAKAAWAIAKSDTTASEFFGKLDQRRRAITSENIDDLFLMRRLGLHDVRGPLSYAIDGLGTYLQNAGAAELGEFVRSFSERGSLIRAPGRALISTDEFFKAIAFRAELRALSLREAHAEAAAKGITDASARKEYVARRLDDLVMNPPDSLVERAKKFAQYVTFQKELGPFGQSLKQLTEVSAVAKVTIPFLTAPGNILKSYFLERTPLGFFSKEIRNALAKGGADADIAMTRISIGSMVTAWFAYLASQGIITGSGPENFDAKQIMRDNGWQDGSINVSKLERLARGEVDDSPEPRKGDHYIKIDRLDPLGLQMVLAADFARIAGLLREEDRERIALALVTAAAKAASSRSWVRGATEMITMASDPERYAETRLRRFAGTFVPFSAFLESTRREVDPVIRDAQSILDSVRLKLYPFSKSVPPDRDIFANPRIYPPGFGPDILSPFYSNVFKDHPVLSALKEDDVAIQKPSRYILGVELTPKEYARYQVLAGKEVKDLMGRNYEQAMLDVIERAKVLQRTTGPDSWRAQEFREVTNAFHKRARQQLLKEFPELREAVRAAKKEERERRGLPFIDVPGGDIQLEVP